MFIFILCIGAIFLGGFISLIFEFFKKEEMQRQQDIVERGYWPVFIERMIGIIIAMSLCLLMYYLMNK